MTGPLLRIDRLSMRFGGLQALDDVSVDVAKGAIHAVIGPNGAGKSTLLNVVSGLYRPTGGAVYVGGARVDGLRADRVCRRGVCRTFQNTELFGDMTAMDNVVVAIDREARYGLAQALLRSQHFHEVELSARSRARELLEFVGLRDVDETPASALSFGRQRRLELARALAAGPSLLLLDEPAAGLRPAEVSELESVLRAVRDRLGITILLVDHVMPLVMKVSDRVTVLNFGRRIAEGPPAEIRAMPAVAAAYLGERSANAVAP